MIRCCIACASADTADLCERCRRDPFSMELARKRVARAAPDRLEALYAPEYAFLSEGHIGTFWDDVLAHDKDTTPEFTAMRNRRTAMLVPAGVRRVLEIGIGRGHMLAQLAEREPRAELYGVDVSAEAVENARRRFAGSFSVADIERLPWPGVTFDLIMMLEVLEHVQVTRTFDVLRAVRERLAPGGWLIISVPLENVDDLRRSSLVCPHCRALVQLNGHLRSYSELEPITAELRLAGFEIEGTYGIAGGRYWGIPRQWLMRVVPRRVHPMVMVFRCRPR